MRIWSSAKTAMPSPEEALRGRSMALPVAPRHAVLGTPMKPPFPDGHELALRTIRASGPGAPEPGGSIRRTAGEVTARGCFRAAWSDEARRARVLNPPKEEVQEQTRTQANKRSHSRGIGM